MKKFIVFILSAVLLLSCFFGCGKTEDKSGSDIADAVSINFASVSLAPGESEQLYASHKDRDEKVLWSSSDDNVVIVDATGFITAINIGEAEITAKVGDVLSTCKVSVVGAQFVPILTLSSEEVSVFAGETFYALAAVTLGGKSVDATVSWNSENPAIATVDNGAITGISAGTTKIIVTAMCGGETVTEKMTVTVLGGESFFIKETGVKLAVTGINEDDKTETELSTFFSSENGASVSAVTWSSDNESVATVDNGGKVTSKAKGVARITATATTSDGDFTAWTDVEVYKSIVKEEVVIGNSEVKSDNSLSLDISAIDYTAAEGEEVSLIVGKTLYDGKVEGGKAVIDTDGTIYGKDTYLLEVKDRTFKVNLEIIAKSVTFKVNALVRNADGEYQAIAAPVIHTIRLNESVLKKVYKYNNCVINTAKSDALKVKADGSSELDIFYEQAIPVANTGSNGFFFHISEKEYMGSDGVVIARVGKFEGKTEVYSVTDVVRRNYIRIVGIDAKTALANGFKKLSFNIYYEGSPNVVGSAYNEEYPSGKLFSLHASHEVTQLADYVTVKNASGAKVNNTSVNVWNTVEIDLTTINSFAESIGTIDFVLGCEAGATFYIQGAKLAQ